MPLSTCQKLDAIAQFSRLKVLVLGDLMLDIYDFCDSDTSRPSPERPGRRVYRSQESIQALGGAGNVAGNLAALEVETSLISICGNDGHHLTLARLAKAHGIDCLLIEDGNRPTTTKTRLYIDGEYILRRDDEVTTEIAESIENKILQVVKEKLDELDAVILSDYDKGFFTASTARQITAACQARKIPVVVDFKPPNRRYFEGADIIAPNHLEAQELMPDFNPTGDLKTQMAALYRLLGCNNLVVTLGARGLCAFTGTTFSRVEANAVKVVDAVGCGDTVRVGLALAFALGMTLEAAAELANDTAAVVLQKIGTATLTLDELKKFVQRNVA